MKTLILSLMVLSSTAWADAPVVDTEANVASAFEYERVGLSMPDNKPLDAANQISPVGIPGKGVLMFDDLVDDTDLH